MSEKNIQRPRLIATLSGTETPKLVCAEFVGLDNSKRFEPKADRGDDIATQLGALLNAIYDSDVPGSYSVSCTATPYRNKPASYLWGQLLSRRTSPGLKHLLGFTDEEVPSAWASLVASELKEEELYRNPLKILFENEDGRVRLRTDLLDAIPLEIRRVENEAPQKERLDRVPVESVDLSHVYEDYADATIALRDFVIARRVQRRPVRHAKVVMFSAFGLRPLIEELLVSCACIDLLMVDPNDSTLDSEARGMIRCFVDVDLRVYAANESMGHPAEVNVYYMPFHDLYAEQIGLDAICLAKGDGYNTSREGGRVVYRSHENSMQLWKHGYPGYMKIEKGLADQIARAQELGAVAKLSSMRM